MDPSSGPQGRSLLDTLSLSTGAGLPVELQSAASATTMKVPFGFPSTSVTSFHASTSGRCSPRPRSPRMSQEEKTSSRRSGRAIKRKKFDDEILDSPGPNTVPCPSFGTMSPPALTIIPTPLPPVTSSAELSPILSSSSVTASQHHVVAPHTGRQSPSSPSPLPPTASASQAFFSGASASPFPVTGRSLPEFARLGKGKGVGKKAAGKKGSNSEGRSTALKKLKLQKKKKPRKDEAWKDLGRWKPADDLALISSVMQTSDLGAVFKGVKFSCHFTLPEIETRWKALMYNTVISKLALQAIRNLPSELVLSVQQKTLFSQQEKDLLSTIKSNRTPSPTVNDFRDLISAHPGIFHFARTPEALLRHWQALKQYTMLPDQSIQPLPRDSHILNFLDAEASINDDQLSEPRDEFLFHELATADRKSKREIRHLEAEVQKWQVLVDTVRGDNPPDFDSQTLAVLRGRLVRYLMRSKEITLGRSTKDQSVDVDLKLEGPAWKISRRQGAIKLKTSGEFFITNEGKRNIFVDGKPIRRGNRVRLHNNSVLEISSLKFVFLINQDLIEAIRQEATRLYQNS